MHPVVPTDRHPIPTSELAFRPTKPPPIFHLTTTTPYARIQAGSYANKLPSCPRLQTIHTSAARPPRTPSLDPRTMGGRSRVKRKAVASADGWTVITHGLADMSLREADTTTDKSKDAAGSMPGVVPGLTVEALLADFKARQARWGDMRVAKQISGLMAKKKAGVCVAVGIGLGSFSRDWEHRHRCLWQLVLFVEVVRLLRELGQPIKIYAQDPAFTSLDKEFLERLDVEVTEAAEQHVLSTSFVFSPFVDWYLLLPEFLKDKSPELYIGNEILDDYAAYAQTEDKRKKLDECNKLGREFLRDREMIKLVDFDLHAHALNGMVVYWKKTAEDNEKAQPLDTPE